MDLRIGYCGFPIAKEKYYEKFEVDEIIFQQKIGEQNFKFIV